MIFIIIEFMQKKIFNKVVSLAPITPLEDHDLERSVYSVSTSETMKSSYEELYELV